MTIIDKSNDGDSFKKRSAELYVQISNLKNTIKVLKKEKITDRVEKYEAELQKLEEEQKQIKEKTGNILLRLNKDAHDRYRVAAAENGISFQQFARYGLAYLYKMLDEKKVKISDTGIEEIE